jgi:hypothetical protein
MQLLRVLNRHQELRIDLREVGRMLRGDDRTRAKHGSDDQK